jgi:hypothetical protein
VEAAVIAFNALTPQQRENFLDLVNGEITAIVVIDSRTGAETKRLTIT